MPNNLSLSFFKQQSTSTAKVNKTFLLLCILHIFIHSTCCKMGIIFSQISLLSWTLCVCVFMSLSSFSPKRIFFDKQQIKFLWSHMDIAINNEYFLMDMSSFLKGLWLVQRIETSKCQTERCLNLNHYCWTVMNIITLIRRQKLKNSTRNKR